MPRPQTTKLIQRRVCTHCSNPSKSSANSSTNASGAIVTGADVTSSSCRTKASEAASKCRTPFRLGEDPFELDTNKTRAIVIRPATLKRVAFFWETVRSFSFDMLSKGFSVNLGINNNETFGGKPTKPITK